MFLVVIVGTTVERFATLCVVLDNHISIFALGTLVNIISIILVIGHEVADFYLVGANPQVQSIVLVKLIFERETANRAAQIK